MEVEQRPREKALRYGLESLSDLELVALILQSGNKIVPYSKLHPMMY